MQTGSYAAAAGAIALLAGGAVSVAQSGVTVTYRKVIISDDPNQSGWSGVFKRLSSPTINESADVAFEGATTASNGGQGVWFGDFNGVATYTVSRVAQEGNTFNRLITGSGASPINFTLDVPILPSTTEGAIGFSLPLLDNAGRLAFIASIDSVFPAAGEAVLWLTSTQQSPFVIAGAPYLKEPGPNDAGVRYHHRWFNADAPGAGGQMRFQSHIALPRAGDGTLAWHANLDTISSSDMNNLPPFAVAGSVITREGGSLLWRRLQ